ncbi:MAG: hypothetical protein QW524_03360 [Candidatus Woesearchaeota archaeon]
MEKTKLITICPEDILKLALFIRIFHDYKGYSHDLGKENHSNAGLFLLLEKIPDEFIDDEIEFRNFSDIKELREILLERSHLDKAIILDLRNQLISNNITLKKDPKKALENFHYFHSFKELKSHYFIESIGTKRETALCIHLATNVPIILMSQTIINTTGTGAIYFFIKRGLYLKLYLQHLSTVPYSYYINPEESLVLISETYSFDKKERTIKRINKEIVNWKNLNKEFLELF